jgi:hypothetical protein
MILQRQVVNEQGHAEYQHAEIYDGDEFTDKQGNWWIISTSGEHEDALINKVLNGQADDENIEAMLDDEIFKYFHNPKIARLCDADTPDHRFQWWDRRWARWIRLIELAVTADYTICEEELTFEIYKLDHDTPVKLY